MASISAGALRLKGLRLQHALARAVLRNPKSPALKAHLSLTQRLNARLRQLAMEERLKARLKRRCPRAGNCDWPYCSIDEPKRKSLR